MATLQTLGTVRLRLRLGGEDYQETLHAVQGDTGRVLEFDVLDSSGAVVTDLTGVTPILFVRKPYGKEVGSATGEIVGGVIRITIPSSLLAYAGVTKAQIQLVDSANQHKLHDHLYRLQIEESLEAGASPGENLWFSLAELTEAIEEVHLLVEQYDTDVAALQDALADVDGIQAQFDTVEARLDSTDAQLNEKVKPEKTTFFKTSKNLFDADYVLGGINPSGAEYADASGASARSGYVGVFPNTQYTLSFKGLDDGFNYYIHFYDVAKTHLRVTLATTSKTITFTTESTDGFIRITTYKSGSTESIPSTTQLELGNVASEYTPNKVLDSSFYELNSIKPKHTDFFKINKNIFNVKWESGRINNDGSENASTEEARTGFIKVNPATTYTISMFGLIGVNYYIYYYNSEKQFVSYVSAGTNGIITFTTDVDIEFVRFKTYKSGGLGIIPLATQLELGSNATDYVQSRIVFDGKYIEEESILPKHTTFFEKTRNIFNTTWEDGMLSNTGELATNPYAKRSDFIPINQNITYTASFTSNLNLYYYFFFYDASKVFISKTLGLAKKAITFTSPANTAYVKVMTFLDGVTGSDLIPLTAQLEVGQDATEYVPYGVQLSRIYLDNNHIKNEINKNMPMIMRNAQIENPCVKAIAHRGYSNIAPENTAPAYILARQMGFKYVECDLQITSDGILVLNHNIDIDHNSNGTGLVSEKTLAELLTYDFGSWKDVKYTGTKILTFEEFIKLCKKLGLKPYIDFKMELEDMGMVVNIVKKYGMLRQVSWLGWTSVLDKIRVHDPKARILYTQYEAPSDWSVLTSRITDEGNVVLNMAYENITQGISDSAVANNIPLEAWIVNDEIALSSLIETSVTGITTDKLLIPQILYNEI